MSRQQDLATALRKADAAGDTVGAKRLADAIRKEQSAKAPITGFGQTEGDKAFSEFASVPSVRTPKPTGLTQVDEMGRRIPNSVEDFQTSDRYAVDRDIAKGVATLPHRVERGAVGALEGLANLPRDTAQSMATPYAMSFDPEVSAMFSHAEMGVPGIGVDPATLPERFSKVYHGKGFAAQQEKLENAPRFDFGGAKVPIPEGMDSVTGSLEEGLAQFIIGRVGVGKLAQGGGLAAQIGKDALTTGVAFDSNAGRLSDILDLNKIPEGPLRDYAAWLRTQPEDSPMVGRFKNMLEDLTLSGPAVAPGLAVRGAQAGLDAVFKPWALHSATPSVAPVTSVPPTTPRAPQGGAAGAGQQPATAPPVLNATRIPPPGVANSVAVAKDDARNIARMMRKAGVPANDVKPLIDDLLQSYQGLNDSRMRLALFAREYLPQKLPKPVADAVSDQFNSFGFQQMTSSGPGAGVMKSSIDEIRNTQKGYLEGEFDAALGKQDLFTTKGKVRKLKSDNADAVYKSQIDRQQRVIANGSGSPEQMAAQDDLLLLMGRKDFFEKIPDELKFAAQNEGFGSLWEYVHTKPLESSHWLQSKLGFLARKGGDNAGLYEQMRKALLTPLEEAVPGYRGARMQHGDAIGQDLAIKMGPEMLAARGSKLKTAELADKFKALPKSQKTVGMRSVKESLLDLFRQTKGSSRVDPVTGEAIDERQVLITQLQKDGTLAALETILGERGKRVTAAIRKTMRENEGVPTYRSDTAPNIKKQEGAIDAVRSPFNKAMRDIGGKTGYGYTIPMDIAAPFMGLPPVFTASKAVNDLVSYASKPNAKKLASTAKLLYGTPPPSNVAPPPPGPPVARGPRKPSAPKPPPTQKTLDELLAEYDRINPGKDPQPAERVRKQIAQVQKQLGKPPQGTNGLVTPTPSTPPEKAGFFSSGSRPLPMDEGRRGLQSSAVRYNGKVYTGETHERAFEAARRADAPVTKNGFDEGFIGADGKFLERSDPRAALDALAANQITDANFRATIERRLKSGTPTGLISDYLDLKPKSLPMDEGARLERAREQGFDVDTPLYHGTAADFAAFDPKKRGSVMQEDDAREAFFFTTRPDTAGGYSREAAFSRNVARRDADPEYKTARADWAKATQRSWRGQPDYKAIDDAERRMGEVEELIGMEDGANVVPAYARLKKPLIVDHIREYDADLFHEVIRHAKAKGHDGVIFKNVQDEVGRGNVSGDIYAVFDPKNIRGKFAKFDPAEAGSSKLLAKIPGEEIAAGGIGASAGANFDYDGDGKISAEERIAGGLGGFVLGAGGMKAANYPMLEKSAQPPAQNSFFPTPKDTRPATGKNGLVDGRPTAKVKPPPSRAEQEARRELKAATAAFTRARTKYGMREDRERFYAPFAEREQAAVDRLNKILKNDAGMRTIGARARSVVEGGTAKAIGAGTVGGLGLSAGIVGINALAPNEKPKNIMSPSDPRFYWTTVTKDRVKMSKIQTALDEWDEWDPAADKTGAYGPTTKAGIRSWRAARGLDPDAPMTRKDVSRLLAGPKGYQAKDGSWSYQNSRVPAL